MARFSQDQKKDNNIVKDVNKGQYRYNVSKFEIQDSLKNIRCRSERTTNNDSLYIAINYSARHMAVHMVS